MTAKANPCAGIKGKSAKGRDAYIDDAVLKAVWGAAELPLRDAIDLAYLTGQRPADVLKLSQADIKDGALTVVQNKTVKRLRTAVEGELAKVIDGIRQRKVIGLTLVNMLSGERLGKSGLRGAFDRAGGRRSKRTLPWRRDSSILVPLPARQGWHGQGRKRRHGSSPAQPGHSSPL